MVKLEEVIRKFVLKNAHDYGKANPGAVVGKVIAEFPGAKKNMKDTMKQINLIIEEVSTLSPEAIEKEMKKYEFVEKKEEEKELEVPDAVEGKVVTRFPPEPSGYPHIGHAKAAFLDYEIARKYKGKMILRFDDTNPEKESEEYVNAIKSGLRWLGIKWEEETYTSDNMKKIYKYAEKLIGDDKAYVCTCPKDDISKMRTESKPCPCRKNEKKENMKRWKGMHKGEYKEGEAVLLFKGNLKSLNTVMRDPSLARLILKKHFRQDEKYKVWPSYDLAVVAMDHLEGITHPMRSKEYELRDELYYALFDALKLKKPKMISFSRLAIKNAPVSKRLLLPLVKTKKVWGWDDPRLPTLEGLKKRGILPDAIKDFVLSFGLSKVESEPTWDALLSENRKLLDPISKRYFFVSDPVSLNIKNALPQLVRLRLHPKKGMGYHETAVKNKVYISKKDADDISVGDSFRLKDLYDVKLWEKGNELIGEYAGNEILPKKVQWVSEEYVETEILVPDDLFKDDKYNENSMKIVKGYSENDCKRLGEGEVIQFERFGFCRLDKMENNKLVFVYSS